MKNRADVAEIDRVMKAICGFPVDEAIKLLTARGYTPTLDKLGVLWVQAPGSLWRSHRTCAGIMAIEK